MKISFTIIMLLACRFVFAQSDNYLTWNNLFPTSKERMENARIYSDNVKLSYKDGFKIKSSGGGNNVNESNLRDLENFYKKHIYDVDLEMKFNFEKGADPTSAVGAAFTTYVRGSGGKVISYRFLLSADGKFYCYIDSAEYSGYKKDLRQFTSKDISSSLKIDGSENTLKILREYKTWTFFVNGVEVASVPDYSYFPISPAHGFRFLFSGKYTMTLNSMKENHSLFLNSIYEDLSLAKEAEGSGYKIENLNSAGHDVIDPNATVKIDLASGDVQITITSPAFGGDLRVYITKTDDDTFEKNKLPAKLAWEYDVTEFTLNPEKKTWELKASKKETGGVTVKETSSEIKISSTETTTTLWLRGSK